MANTGRRQFGSTPAEFEIVKLIKLMARKRKGGKTPSLSQVARDVNELGHCTQTGKLWRPQSIKNVLNSDITNKAKQSKVKKTGLATGDYLSHQQLTKIFKVCTDYALMIVAVLVGSGLRAGELCALQIRDLGIHDGKSQVDVRRGKGAKQRCVFISQELAASLRDYLGSQNQPKKRPVFYNARGGELTYQSLYSLIKKLGRLAGIPDVHPHTFRHTFGTLLYNYKKDLFFVMEQLGHAKVDTTQIYAKTLTESKLEQMKEFGSDIFSKVKKQRSKDNTSKI